MGLEQMIQRSKEVSLGVLIAQADAGDYAATVALMHRHHSTAAECLVRGNGALAAFFQLAAEQYAERLERLGRAEA